MVRGLTRLYQSTYLIAALYEHLNEMITYKARGSCHKHFHLFFSPQIKCFDIASCLLLIPSHGKPSARGFVPISANLRGSPNGRALRRPLQICVPSPFVLTFFLSSRLWGPALSLRYLSPSGI